MLISFSDREYDEPQRCTALEQECGFNNDSDDKCSDRDARSRAASYYDSCHRSDHR